MRKNIENKAQNDVTKSEKSIKIDKPKLEGFSFFHKGKEYIIQAENQNEARALFKELIQQK